MGAPAVAFAPPEAEVLPLLLDPPPVGLAFVWVRLLRLAGLLGVVCCLCRTSTAGASPAAGAGALLGAGIDGPVVVVADVDVEEGALEGVLAGAVDVLVVDWPEPVVDVPTSGVVEVTGGSAPSPVVVEPVGVSAPRAPPASGPPRPATVSPPPASADSIARQVTREAMPRRGPMPRKPLIGGLP